MFFSFRLPYFIELCLLSGNAKYGRNLIGFIDPEDFA